MEIKEQIQEIKEKIGDKNKLVINRVPINTLKRFHEIANEDDFCKDYGMVLKYLIDFHDGILGAGNEHLEVALTELDIRVSALEQNSSQTNEKAHKEEIIMGDGRIITSGKKEA